MKKSFIFLATAFLLNASVAKSSSSPPLLDDSASFRIAKSVKLGYGEDSSGVTPSLNKKPKDVDFNVCPSDKPYWVSGQCRECPSGKVFVLNQCVPDKTCAEYGEEQGEYWYSSFDGWHAGCPDDRPKPAPTGVIGSDGSCNKCVANVTIGGVTTPGGFTPQGNCAGNQLSCNFGGSSVCCPYSTKGCKEYENDCQVNAYGTLATTCRCIGTSMP